MKRAFIIPAGALLLIQCNTLNRTENRSTNQSLSNSTISAMKENFYTHALWHVKEGKTADFIAAWERFGNALSQIPNAPPLKGTLIQSLSEPTVFYSFGPWQTLEDINAMRNNENVKKAMADIMELCLEAKPGNYKTVLQLAFPSTRKQ